MYILSVCIYIYILSVCIQCLHSCCSTFLIHQHIMYKNFTLLMDNPLFSKIRTVQRTRYQAIIYIHTYIDIYCHITYKDY